MSKFSSVSYEVKWVLIWWWRMLPCWWRSGTVSCMGEDWGDGCAESGRTVFCSAGPAGRQNKQHVLNWRGLRRKDRRRGLMFSVALIMAKKMRRYPTTIPNTTPRSAHLLRAVSIWYSCSTTYSPLMGGPVDTPCRTKFLKLNPKKSFWYMPCNIATGDYNYLTPILPGRLLNFRTEASHHHDMNEVTLICCLHPLTHPIEQLVILWG